MSQLLVDVEGPLRTWLKAQSAITDVTGDAKYVYFAAPDSNDKPDCWLTMSRIGGGPDPYVPIDDALITFGCWGKTKAKAAELAAALASLLYGLQAPTTMGAAIARQAQITSWTFQPDGGLPRYVVDAAIFFSAAP